MKWARVALLTSAWFALPSIVAACSGNNDSAPPPPSSDAAPTVTPPGPTDPCAPAGKGCPCGTPGQQIDCSAKRISGSYVACSPGKMTCGDDKKWGDCIGDAVIWDPDASVADTGAPDADTGSWF